MSSANVVTSQPTPTAPPSEDDNLEKPSAPIADNVIITQPLLNGDGDLKLNGPEHNDSAVVTQPIFSENSAEEEDAEKVRRTQRNLDFCCFVCADSLADDDAFCWYFFCRMLCNGCGHCCEGIAHCTDSCCEGCASCCHDCCDGQDGCCSGNGGCDGCCGDGGNGVDGGCCDGADGGGCCDGGSADAGDCDCDCNCFD